MISSKTLVSLIGSLSDGELNYLDLFTRVEVNLRKIKKEREEKEIPCPTCGGLGNDSLFYVCPRCVGTGVCKQRE